MAAAQVNLVLEQGATFTASVTVDLDLTGYIVRMQGRTSIDASATLFDIDSGAKTGITIDSTSATSSTFTYKVAASATAAMSLDAPGVYDIEIDDQGGTPVVTRVLEGKLIWSKEVTR